MGRRSPSQRAHLSRSLGRLFRAGSSGGDEDEKDSCEKCKSAGEKDGKPVEETAMTPGDHEHEHDAHNAADSGPALRVKALEALLVEKGLVDPAALDSLIDTYEHKVGPRNGARVVARAWVDHTYKQRLLTDATAAIAELGYTGPQGEHVE